MRLKVVAILVLIIASLVVLSAAQSPDYTGKAKIVIKLTKMPDMPAMPEASDASGLVPTTFGFSAPAVPQGEMLTGEVLYSSDPAIKTGNSYTLYVNYDQSHEPTGFQAGLVDQLKSGAIVGVNDYTLNGDQIVVNVGAFDDWRQKVFIVDAQFTDPNEQKNPFSIDLNGFRQFDSTPSFNTTTFSPMFNMSFSPMFSTNTSIGTAGSGLFGMFSHLFG